VNPAAKDLARNNRVDRSLTVAATDIEPRGPPRNEMPTGLPAPVSHRNGGCRRPAPYAAAAIAAGPIGRTAGGSFFPFRAAEWRLPAGAALVSVSAGDTS
jgi:hypothetical protein